MVIQRRRSRRGPVWAVQALMALGVFVVAQAAAPDSLAPIPLTRAHAHNDYEHSRPLQDALEQGFCSVEADVHLIDGQLLVAHDRRDAKLERTLQTLYLEPLRAQVDRNGGRVFPSGPTFHLLIDFKTGGETTYAALRAALRSYRPMLTEFRPDGARTNAVTIIISGNRPQATVAAEAVRWVAIDGRLPDLETRPPTTLVPWVSDNWRNHFHWDGEGTMPAEEFERLGAMVQAAHQQGRLIRLWATPDRPSAWQALLESGVDLINTDRLADLAEFLRVKASENP